jgi:hypothetical protein
MLRLAWMKVDWTSPSGYLNPYMEELAIRGKIVEVMEIDVLELERKAGNIAAGRVLSNARSRAALPEPSIFTNIVKTESVMCTTWLLEHGFDVYATNKDFELALVLGFDHDDKNPYVLHSQLVQTSMLRLMVMVCYCRGPSFDGRSSTWTC